MQLFWDWRQKLAKMSSPLIADVSVAIGLSAVATNVLRLMFS
jgi:hypothetical protein